MKQMRNYFDTNVDELVYFNNDDQQTSNARYQIIFVDDENRDYCRETLSNETTFDDVVQFARNAIRAHKLQYARIERF